MVAGGPGLADSLGVNCNELIPVAMNAISGVAGHARVLGGIFVRISATDANGNAFTAK